MVPLAIRVFQDNRMLAYPTATGCAALSNSLSSRPVVLRHPLLGDKSGLRKIIAAHNLVDVVVIVSRPSRFGIAIKRRKFVLVRQALRVRDRMRTFIF
jgi:hypothetical protein